MELPTTELSQLDFHSTNSTWIRFPKQRLPSGTVTDFEWKDYCPHVFRNLQQLDNISYADYMVSICAHETLQELTLKGKSGTLRFSPDDHRFVIQIIRKSELKTLMDMLPNYYDHVLSYVNTLLNKLYGIHVVRPAGGCKIHFIVAANILQSDLYLHRCYDLKGSSQGRSLNKVAVDDFTLFKDFDLERYFLLNPLTRHQVLTQIKHDCDFLEAAGIMDYSLLLGIHIKASIRGSFNESTNSRTSENKFSLPPDISWSQGGESSSNDNQNYYEPDARLGREISARAIQIPKHDPESNSPHRLYPSGEPFNVKLNFGIIDILKGYSVKKRIEHMYKSIQFDSRSISAVNPRVYSSRFQDFLSRVFQSEDSVL